MIARFFGPKPGATREEKMEQAGFSELPMERNVSLLSMRGGNGLCCPNPGDDVELYADDPTKKEQANGRAATWP